MEKKTKLMKKKSFKNYFEFYPIVHKPKSVHQLN